ncbi:amidase signature domain-containing protein [Xylariales sp. PMI_506]|nr:amidase signature domain-containing protein [Xylariales sp. PMI_506]
MAAKQRFIGYPKAREGPVTPYDTRSDEVPVLRGWSLVLFANVIRRSSWFAKSVWTNTKFGEIQHISILEDYEWRMQPTVTPLITEDTPERPGITPELMQRQPDDLRGRFYSAADYHELYKSGKLTPLQVVDALLPLIARGQDPPAKYELSWAVTHRDIVLKAAKESTERYAQGKPLSAIDGVPFGVKDDLDVKGYIAHKGLAYIEGHPFFKPAEKTNWAVQQLEAAGGLMVSTLAMHELGSDVNGCNPRWGTPVNWNNPSYYPGASSSGGGSAICAGLIPIGLGTDAGGSIRIPSSLCGIYGLKPTLHRGSTLPSAIAVLGPMAATVADLTIAYRLISAPNPEDVTQSAFAPSIPPSPSAKKYIGIYNEWFDHASPAVLELTKKAVAYYKDTLGYEVVDITIPYIKEAQVAHSQWALTEAVDHQRTRAPSWSRLDPYAMVNHCNLSIHKMAMCTSGVDLIKCGQMRSLIMEHLAFLFQKYPGLLIVTPTVPEAGWKIHPGDQAYGLIDGPMTFRMMMYIWLSNSTGCPAVSVPVGYAEPEQGEGRLPVGLMATGEWGAEEQLLAWAKEAETYLNEVVEGGRSKPKDWADVIGIAKGDVPHP